MVATSKPAYYVGEKIQVLISVTTVGNLSFSSSLQTRYYMDGVYATPDVGATVLTYATTPRTWTNNHSWTAYNLALGTHSVIGTVVGYGTSTAATFEIIPTPPSQDNFLLNFQTIPNTTAQIENLIAYDAVGVHFHTKQGAVAGLQSSEGNSWVQGFDAYPIGFHVIADFAMPVFGASANVAGGTGVRITMIAKNAQGQTIATNVSAPMAHPGQFEQTLSVTTTEPIALLEWWPSIPNSSAGVDDLFVVTSPPLKADLVGTKLRMNWPTIAGANYQLWSSPDLKVWSPCGSVCTGAGNRLTNEIPMTGTSAQFFRITKVD